MKLRLLFTLLVLTVLAWTAASVWKIQTEARDLAQLRQSTRKALLSQAPALAGEDFDILIDGQTGVIVGTVHSGDTYGSVTEAIANLRESGVLREIGLATLYNGLTRQAAPWITLSHRGPTEIIVEGLLPARSARRITSRLRTEFPPDAITLVDRVEVSDATYVPAWDEALGDLAPVFLKAARDGELRIEDGSATLTGRVITEEARLSVEEAVSRGLGSGVHHVFNRLRSDPEVPNAVPCELTLASDTGDRSITLSGRFATEEIRQALVARMRAVADAAIAIRDEIEVDPRVPETWWPTLVGPLFKEFAANPWLKRIRVSADTVELSGPTPDDEEKSRLLALARQVFNEATFHLDDRLMVDAASYATLAKAHPEIAPMFRTPEIAAAAEAEATAIAQTAPAFDPDTLPPIAPTRLFSDPPSDAAFQNLASVASAATVYFDYHGAKLGASYERNLGRLAAALHATPESGLSLRAYLSPKLDAQAQAQLRAWRCNVISNSLASLGVDPERLSFEPEIRVADQARRAPSWRDHRIELIPRHCARIDGKTDVSPLTASTEPATDSGHGQPELEPVYFNSNSTSLSAAEKRKLDEIAATLLGAQDKTIALRGRTDRWGDPELNARLADLRSQSVRAYLSEKGISEERLAIRPATIIGQAADEADDKRPAWQSRRVEFTLE